MAAQIHYEIYWRQGAKGGFTLYDALPRRDEALKLAAQLLSEGRAAGVRVCKETYDERTGLFATLKIFEDGKTLLKPREEDPALPSALPCFKPDDLYSVHARAVIARLIPDTLARLRLTVTEFLHRADVLEKFEATGTVFQHAVQKIAVAQADAAGRDVAQIVKALNELCHKAMQAVFRDEREGRLVEAKAGGFAALCEKFSAQPRGGYLLRGAIAKYLAQAASWDEKLRLTLGLLDELPQAEKPRALLVEAVDTLVSEIAAGASALKDLLGQRKDLGDALLAMTELVLARIPASDARAGLARLSGEFAQGRFLAARAALARRVLAELRSLKRLSHESLGEEVRLMRLLASRLVLAEERIVAKDEIVGAFVVRSKRLVMPEAIGEYLAGAADPLEKLSRLLHLEENVVGAENKRRLFGFVQPLLFAHQTEACVLGGSSPLARLRALAELETRALRSGFQDIERRQILDALDVLALKCEKKHRLFEQFAPEAANAVERALGVLKLLAAGAPAQGEFGRRLREILREGMKETAFAASYAAGSGRAPEAAAAELSALLSRAGLAA